MRLNQVGNHRTSAVFSRTVSGSCLPLIVLVIILFIQVNALGQETIIIGPDYKPDLRLTDLNNPKGLKITIELPLNRSKIYRGDDVTLDPDIPIRSIRKVYVYIPLAYRDGDSAPVLVTLDGPGHFQQISNLLDNLTSGGEQDKLLPLNMVS